MIEIQTKIGIGGEDSRLLCRDLMDAYVKATKSNNIEILDFQKAKNSFSLYL